MGGFLLTWSDLRFPEHPVYYALNLASAPQWEQGMGRFVAWLNRPDTPSLSQRYIGTAVADFHRNLLHGGVFGYPGEVDRPEGKLRLLYEGVPLAYLLVPRGDRSSQRAGGDRSGAGSGARRQCRAGIMRYTCPLPLGSGPYAGSSHRGSAHPDE